MESSEIETREEPLIWKKALKLLKNQVGLDEIGKKMQKPEFINGTLILTANKTRIELKRESDKNTNINVKISEEGKEISLDRFPHLFRDSNGSFKSWLKVVLGRLKDKNFNDTSDTFWVNFDKDIDIPDEWIESFDNLDKYKEKENHKIQESDETDIKKVEDIKYLNEILSKLSKEFEKTDEIKFGDINSMILEERKKHFLENKADFDKVFQNFKNSLLIGEIPYIIKKIDEYNTDAIKKGKNPLPYDIIFVAGIESHWNKNVNSDGYWQFTELTGKDYGLVKYNSSGKIIEDNRKLVSKSSDAAISYLGIIYNDIKDTYPNIKNPIFFTMYAFNMGLGGTKSIIKRVKDKLIDESSYLFIDEFLRENKSYDNSPYVAYLYARLSIIKKYILDKKFKNIDELNDLSINDIPEQSKKYEQNYYQKFWLKAKLKSTGLNINNFENGDNKYYDLSYKYNSNNENGKYPIQKFENTDNLINYIINLTSIAKNGVYSLEKSDIEVYENGKKIDGEISKGKDIDIRISKESFYNKLLDIEGCKIKEIINKFNKYFVFENKKILTVKEATEVLKDGKGLLKKALLKIKILNPDFFNVLGKSIGLDYNINKDNFEDTVVDKLLELKNNYKTKEPPNPTGQPPIKVELSDEEKQNKIIDIFNKAFNNNDEENIDIRIITPEESREILKYGDDILKKALLKMNEKKINIEDKEYEVFELLSKNKSLGNIDYDKYKKEEFVEKIIEQIQILLFKKYFNDNDSPGNDSRIIKPDEAKKLLDFGDKKLKTILLKLIKQKGSIWEYKISEILARNTSLGGTKENPIKYENDEDLVNKLFTKIKEIAKKEEKPKSGLKEDADFVLNELNTYYPKSETFFPNKGDIINKGQSALSNLHYRANYTERVRPMYIEYRIDIKKPITQLDIDNGLGKIKGFVPLPSSTENYSSDGIDQKNFYVKKELLNEINIIMEEFQKRMKQFGIPEGWKIKPAITSATRSEEGNGELSNSSPYSAHKFGLGADIGYNRFYLVKEIEGKTKTLNLMDLVNSSGNNIDNAKSILNVAQKTMASILAERDKSGNIIFTNETENAYHFHITKIPKN